MARGNRGAAARAPQNESPDRPQPTLLDEVLDESMRVVEGTALEQLNRAEIDMQIATARKYPRSIKAFRQQAEELATMDAAIAASCFYRLQRDGKVIEGPSVRMAEIVLSTYGNMRSGSRIVQIGDRTVTGQGFAHDLEKNNASSVEVDRRITTKAGRRYGDDMIVVTGNAACSIALRNAVFRVIPQAFIKPILEKAKIVSLGTGLTMEQRRAEAIAWYVKRGATEKQVLASLDRAGVDDLDIEDLLTLRGMATAIKDKEITLEDALRTPEQREAAKRTRSADWDLAQTLAAKQAAGGDLPQPATPESAPETEPQPEPPPAAEETTTTSGPGRDDDAP